jgi:hypothetical protein
MKTITMNIDDDVLSQAEAKAAALSTSVGEVAANLLQRWANEGAVAEAQKEMAQRFAHPDWQFSVGTLEDREQRNARP